MPHKRIRPEENTSRRELPMPHKRIRPEENTSQRELPMPHKRIPNKEPIWNTYRKKYPLKQTVTLDDVSSDSDLPTDDSNKRELPKAKDETPSLTSSLPKPTGPSLTSKRSNPTRIPHEDWHQLALERLARIGRQGTSHRSQPNSKEENKQD
jgi:hypothetical protein